ncbi:glycosyltransferase family 2 protein [Schizophyllum fasciatum]
MPPLEKSSARILVTGGAGYSLEGEQGSHVAKRLVAEGFPFVRIADKQEIVYDDPASICHEFMHGDLKSARFAASAMTGITHVLHFASNMGGMGTIHSDNDLVIYSDNHAMTLNVLQAAMEAKASHFLYASSACVYPDDLQTHNNPDVQLREDEVWVNRSGPPQPQGLYGQEKLISEMLLAQCEGKIEVRIARFHNVYGPRGAWNNGREKAPAAMLRKALVAARMLARSPNQKPTFEIWGDGRARRSFLYIDDCVDAVMGLLASDYSQPLNVGTEQAVTVQELAHIALGAAGLKPTDVNFNYDGSKPIGVASRNSHNELVRRVLKWEPHVDLQAGMRMTAEWLTEQLERCVEQDCSLESLQRSTLLRMGHERVITFAILLPVTSRCSSGAHSAEPEISAARQTPRGFGCVAFTDESFPGMPTFPVVHRRHLDMFSGEIIPDVFVNQDGDPYLYTLYRKFGCSRMLTDCRLSNAIGGQMEARYVKESAPKWSFEPLRLGMSRLRSELAKAPYGGVHQEKLSLDIVVPSYRVNLDALEAILSLQPSSSCDTMYIIVIDDPHAKGTEELLKRYEHRPDVRIRVHLTNLGASAARNRGMAESTADWVLFLDDDVSPEPNLLLEVEKSIRARPSAAGFVGHCKFPVADTVFKAAVHYAGVTYFWAIATQIDCAVPWGVTANLVARRSDDGVQYDLGFPKTGGGEDIDFCLKKAAFSLANGSEAFHAAPGAVVTHPWWNDGKRSYWRFYKWSEGDGGLIKMYPQHSYRDYAPNAAECLFLCGGLFVAGTTLFRMDIIRLALAATSGVILSNVLVDVYRHLVLDDGSNIDNVSRPIQLTRSRRALAIVESTFVRIFSEMGRTVGLLRRGEYTQLGLRFDWFAGRWGDGPKIHERKNNLIRMGLAGCFVGGLVHCFGC